MSLPTRRIGLFPVLARHGTADHNGQQMPALGDGELALPDGTPCVRLVLPLGKAHAVDGELMMVDVEVGQAGPSTG